ncbi:proteoglycan 4-like [Penaeus japonicus]|uniref:proteoglycan 4-like n=1 Tax=Penaeus japonicus TaxID=27405 RepID=UPI001C71506C|nr:proteoglycan 4-like [Penaeus japonicus]
MGALRAFVVVLSLAVTTRAQSPLQILEDVPTATPSNLLTTIPMSDATVPESEKIEGSLLADKNKKLNMTGIKDQNLQDIREKILSTMPSSEPAEATTEEETVLGVSTVTPTPEPLPTPLPVQINIDNEKEILQNPAEEKPVGKKKSSVPKKGVVYEPPVVPKKGADPESQKSSVVPKKGADPENQKSSVVPKKGADPESQKSSVVPKKDADPSKLKPSVVPKKGADPKDIKPSVVPKKGVDSGLLSPIVSEANMQIPAQSDPTTVKASTVSNANAVPSEKVKFDPSSAVNALPSSPQKKPTPSLISPTKASKGSPTPSPVIPTVHLAAQNESSNSSEPESSPPSTASSESHLKPTAAVDNLDAEKEDSGGSAAYTPAAVGIILLLCIVITVMILGIRRLQDVWMRRHYARMDFLIDGMYDM